MRVWNASIMTPLARGLGLTVAIMKSAVFFDMGGNDDCSFDDWDESD